jgi:hypothetical protein
MPSTNFQPPGYELIHRDDELCRGSVFYTPGSGSSNWINAHNVAPLFLLYRRLDAWFPMEPGGPGGHTFCRIGFCCHYAQHQRNVAKQRREADVNERLARKRARHSEELLRAII